MPGIITCPAQGYPSPDVIWMTEGGSHVKDVKDVRKMGEDGGMRFEPFPPEMYRKNIHDVKYRCMVTSTVGTVISKLINVRAGK